MKAIVMAGGEGTRLRPLTSGIPKPMVELFGKPVLEHTVELLKRNGIKDICFTLGYLPKIIEDYFGDGDGFGVNIETRVEKTPLGTAGGVRACSDFIGKDDVLIISGDAVCDFNLAKCAEVFYEKKCDALLVLYEHSDPVEYGTVITDGEGKIRSFIEKPDWNSVVTNRINTGIYILSSKTVNLIPEKGMYDFGKDLFPQMLKEGANLCGYCAEGYWCDVGSPEAYRQCCADILRGKTGVDMGVPQRKKGIWSVNEIPHGCDIIPPVFIGRNCTLGKGAKIGPETVLGDGTNVGENTKIAKSVVGGASLGKNAEINGAVICHDTSIGDKTEITQGCVIGEKCSVGAGCLLENGIKIWPKTEIYSGSRVTENITESTCANQIKFGTDRKIYGKMPYPMSAEAAFAMGAVLGKMGSVGVSFAGSEAAAILGDAAACGARSAGAEVLVLDCDFECEASYAAELYGIDNSLFIRQKNSDAVLTFFSKNGADAPNGTRRKIEASFSGEHPRVSASNVGSKIKTEGTSRAYVAAAVRSAWDGKSLPKNFRVSVTGHGAENRALRKALSSFGAEITERRGGVPLFQCEEGGFSLYAEDEEGRTINGEKLAVLTAAAAFERGAKTVAVGFDAPSALEDVAKRYGGKILRFGWDSGEEKRAYTTGRYMRDGIFACLMLCRFMAERSMKLSELLCEIPEFSRSEKRVNIACGRARMMRELAETCTEYARELTDGLAFTSEKGRVRIQPCCDGKALRIMSEAANEEMAEELCADFERRINSVL